MKDPQFPEGKIHRDDEGAIEMAIGADLNKKVIMIRFPKPVVWFALEPSYVRRLVTILLAKVAELEGTNKNPVE